MKIGDKVKVVDLGLCFTEYRSKFKKLGFKDPDKSHQLDSIPNPEDNVFTVINIEGHDKPRYGLLYAIEDKYGNQFLFGRDGIEVISSVDFKLEVIINGVVYVPKDSQN